MRRIFLLVFLISFTLVPEIQAAAENQAWQTERKKAAVEVDRVVEYDTVIENLKKWNLAIERSRKKYTPLAAIRYFSFCNKVQEWMNYPWFVADSGLSKEWLKKAYDLLAYMQKTKSYMEVAEFNGKTQSAKYKKAVEYFNIAHVRFVELIKKPVKVAFEVQRQAHRKKVEWQKMMRKKYKLKE